MSEFEIMGLNANVLTLVLDGENCEPVFKNASGSEMIARTMTGRALRLSGEVKIDVSLSINDEDGEIWANDCSLNLKNAGPFWTDCGLMLDITDFLDLRFHLDKDFADELNDFIMNEFESIKVLMAENNAADKAELECEL